MAAFRSIVVVAVFLLVGCGRTLLGGDGLPGAGHYAAVGSKGTLLRSVDGASWTAVNSPTSQSLLSVTASEGIFVAVGVGGTILTSPDAKSWTAQVSGTKTDLTHVIFTGEKFLAVGGSWDTGAAMVESRDGATWTAVSAPANYMFRAIAHKDSTVVASAAFKSDLQTPALFTASLTPSSAGSAWTKGVGPDFNDSVTLDDRLVVIGRGVVASSRDGVSWTQQKAVADRAIAWSGETFVIVGEAGSISTSTEGTRWTAAQNTLGSGGWLSGVAFGKPGGFVAVGGRGAIVTSPDAQTWTTRASTTTLELNDVAFGP